MGIEFGKCLHTLLSVRGWSAARMAREANIDSSYVRRWINGERVPGLRSNHVERLAGILCKGLELSSMSVLNDAMWSALNELGQEKIPGAGLEASVLELLRKAQLVSLKMSPEERSLKVGEKIDEAASFLKKINQDSYYRTAGNLETQDKYMLPESAMLISGRENVLKAMVALAANASQLQGINGSRILLTFQGEYDMFAGFDAEHEKWFSLISRCLNQGWNLKHLIRLNRNVSRSLELVSEIVGWLGNNGKYEPFYFERYGTLNAAHEIAIFEGVGALVCFPTTGRDQVDAAFFHGSPQSLDALADYFNVLGSRAEPLVKAYSSEEYFIMNTETDHKTGDRYIIRDDLDAMTLPYDLWEIYIERAMEGDETAQRHLERIQNRIVSFHQLLVNYKVRNICTTRAIEHLASQGNYLVDHVFRRPEMQDVKRHLEYLIELLEENENFELGLIGDDQAGLMPPTYWEVKGTDHVIMELWRIPLFMEITEGTIAETFAAYCSDIWDRITPRFKDKHVVIDWLKRQLEGIRIEEA